MQAEKTGHRDDGMNSRRLIASVVSDVQQLVTLEVALARQELKELAARNAIAAAMVTFGAMLLVLAVFVVTPALVVVLVPWHWQAAAVWLAAYLVSGLVLVLVGKSRIQLRLPPRTMETLKESKEWALRRVRSNGR
ncbi:MAG TPA: phage holin family protein [Verrucomicrobiae bacterium]|nr:phage holin family protein [Verrucomicrobiae bacterium]